MTGPAIEAAAAADKVTMGAAQRRVLRLLLVLCGNELTGLKLSEIAKALGVATPTALRDLRVMADEGFAERIPGMEDRWRLAPKPVQIALAYQRAVSTMRTRLGEAEQRYTREPK